MHEAALSLPGNRRDEESGQRREQRDARTVQRDLRPAQSNDGETLGLDHSSNAPLKPTADRRI